MNSDLAREKWNLVLEKLWSRSRFASYFFQSIALADNPGVPTLALSLVDHRFILFFNRRFVLDISADCLIGLLIHEMLHVVLNHDHRVRPGQNVYLCNLAQDMVINTYLKAQARTFFSRKSEGAPSALRLPPGLPEIPDAFGIRPGRNGIGDVTWEEVYTWLKGRYTDPNEQKRERQDADGHLPGFERLPGSDQSRNSQLPAEGLGFVDGQRNPLPTGIHLFGETDAGQRTRAGAERILGFIRKHGECRDERLYSDLSRLIKAPRPAGNLKWKRAVRTIADQVLQANRWDYAFSRPNRRFFDAGIYAPGRYMKNKPLVTIVVDVSGSMAANPGEIEAAFGAVEDLSNTYRINLLCIDQDLFVPRKQGQKAPVTSRKGCYLYQKGDWRYIKTGSRGATFFAPLFNDYMKHHTEALIVITDGEIYDLDALRPYSSTLWVISGNRSAFFTPPFGRVMTIGDDP